MRASLNGRSLVQRRDRAQREGLLAWRVSAVTSLYIFVAIAVLSRSSSAALPESMLHHSKTRSRPQLVRAKSPLVSAQKIAFGEMREVGVRGRRRRAMWTWMQKLLGTSPTETEQAPDVHLKASSQTSLSRALHKLKPGQRGWVTIAEAGPLFSADDVNPLSEMDHEGRRTLETFAAKQRHRQRPR